MTRLECQGLTGGHGTTTAFRDIDLQIDAGTIHALLGPNGAGKSSLLLTLAGLLPAHKGTVTVDGHKLRSGNPVAASRAGIVLVPDNRALFTTLTVAENLHVARNPRGPHPRELIDTFPSLEKRWHLTAGALSGGEQQMLAMARALIQQPQALLIDEMSLGLAPKIVETLLDTVRQVAHDHATAIVLVEQHATLALDIADHATILNHGTTTHHSPAHHLRNNPERLHHAYFGTPTPTTTPG